MTASDDIDTTGSRSTLVTDPVQAGIIKLKNRLRIMQGEWFRDTRVGSLWLRLALGVKKPDPRILSNLVLQTIKATPPFIGGTVTALPLTPGRVANFTFTAIVDPAVLAGATVTAASLEAPFILNLPSTGN